MLYKKSALNIFFFVFLLFDFKKYPKCKTCRFKKIQNAFIVISLNRKFSVITGRNPPIIVLHLSYWVNTETIQQELRLEWSHIITYRLKVAH